MANVDKNRIDGLVKKHTYLKRWVSIMLVLALLVTTVTMYALNKSATAVSEDTADNVGMVLADTETESEQADGSLDSSEASSDSSEDGSSQEENSDSSDAGSTDASGEENSGDNSSDNSSTESSDSNAEETTSSSEDSSNSSSEESSNSSSEESSDSNSESSESTDDASNDSSEESSDDASNGNTEEDADAQTGDTEEVNENNDEELTQDVVLTVSYKDENGESIADDKEINISESINFSEEAPEIEGYTFKNAEYDNAVITKITVKKDANEYKYYEVTLEDESTVEVKKDATVVLAYNTVVASNIKLTAKFIDKSGEELKESAELAISSETDLTKKDNVDSIENYFYINAKYDDKKITKITPVVSENEGDQDENEKKISSYDITTKDGDTVTVTEDAEIVLTYYKASEETNYEFSDDKLTVKATVDEGAFPEDIELAIKEVNAATEGYNYDAYIQALNDNADKIANTDSNSESDENNESEDESEDKENVSYDEKNTILYDIAFMLDGVEYQPASGSVNVSFEFKDKQLTDTLSATDEKDITVVHLPIKDDVKEESDANSTEEATDITADDVEVKPISEATAEVHNDEKIEFTEDSFSIFAVMAYSHHEPGTDTFETVLGDAINFGIVTNSLDVSESQTNFAVKYLKAGGQFGNDLTNNAEQTFIAGSIDGTFNIKGYPAHFITPAEYASHIVNAKDYTLSLNTAYTSSELNKAIDDMLQYSRDASADLVRNQNNDNTVYLYPDRSDNPQWYWIDTTNFGAGTYYVTITDDDLRNKINSASKLKIYKNSNQTIVFNVTATNPVYLQKFEVSTDLQQFVGSDAMASKGYTNITRTLIWNFINAPEVYSTGGVSGVFISGRSDSKWTNQVTSSGWLLFPNVVLKAQEWHNTYDGIRQISGTAQLQAYKTIDGKNSTVTGFWFTLYRQDGNSWTKVEECKNDSTTPHNVIFSTITYGGDKDKAGNTGYQYVDIKEGESTDIIYRIVESKGTTDSEGKAYTADSTEYYAKVTVSKKIQNEYSKVKTYYYEVGTPIYYKNMSLKNKVNVNGSNIPVFNNKEKKGSIGLELHKYLNGKDPGEHTYSFTVRALKSDGRLETVTKNGELKNKGADINFTFKYNSNYLFYSKLHFVITEDDIAKSDTTSKKDTSYIFVMVENPGEKSQKITYYRVSADDSRLAWFEENVAANNSVEWYFNDIIINNGKHYIIKKAEEVAFYNEGVGNLRIHKMVVNDYGSDFVRDANNNTKFGDALLTKVKFRVTRMVDNKPENYIVLQGFVGHDGDKGEAYEYDAVTHENIKTYVAIYNGKAQWLIKDLPAGTYAVEEVADGYTFTYDAATNTSTTLEYSVDENGEKVKISRITKYDLTVDDEDKVVNDDISGKNWRKLFSVDMTSFNDQGPVNVSVGSVDLGNKNNTTQTQTVQIANYYSIPVGPIEVTKNFSGAEWTDDLSFTFMLKPTGYQANTSEGNVVKLNSQPMPETAVYGDFSSGTDENGIAYAAITISGNTQKVVGKVNDQWVKEKAVTKNEDGTYSTVAKFASIPYRYEGTYYYEISEQVEDKEGIVYDRSVYYVKVEVKKKQTTFTKTYSKRNNPHTIYEYDSNLNKYKSYSVEKGEIYIRDEMFFYLGADVTYAMDSSFRGDSILAVCSLNLDENPDTVKLHNNEFFTTYTSGSASAVAFNNFASTKLIIKKVWKKSGVDVTTEDHSTITVNLHRVKDGKDEIIVDSIQISKDTKENNNEPWTKVINVKKEANCTYYIEEVSDTALVVTYSNGSTIDTDPKKVTVTDDGNGVLTLTVTNELGGNVLPSTGGTGSMPFVIAGLGMVTVALIGNQFLRKKKEDEE